MSRQIYINLPVRDVSRATAFYLGLGFSLEPKFSNADASAIVIDQQIFVMLLAEPFFKSFTDKALCSTSTHIEVLNCLSCSSRQEVDDFVAHAIQGGGRAPRAVQDMGFMYGHAFEDLDGHTWELVYMDPNAQPLA